MEDVSQKKPQIRNWGDDSNGTGQKSSVTRELRDEYVRASIALSSIRDIGAGRIRELFHAFDSPMSVFSRSWTDLAAVKNIKNTHARAISGFKDWRKVDELLHITEKHRFTLLTPFDPAYPPRLKHIYDLPPLLWVKGNLKALARHFMAVVGTRKPSSAGRELTLQLTRDLVRKTGVGIVSGLANGIDTLAHKVTLEEKGCTVAVLGSGIDRIYPRSNIRLAQQIVENGGALISEFVPGTKPDAHNFPTRNRVVSGISLGVLVTETGETGGSKITVHRALDQNREVFIVPHDVRNPKGMGSNEIIQKNWGKLVCRADDIIEELPDLMLLAQEKERRNPNTQKENPGINQNLNRTEQKICEILSGEPLHIDNLSQKINMPVKALLPVLLELELKGIIIQKSGKKFTCPEW